VTLSSFGVGGSLGEANRGGGVPGIQLRPRHAFRLRRAAGGRVLRDLAQGYLARQSRSGDRPRRLQLRRLPALRRHSPLQPRHGGGDRLREQGRAGAGDLQLSLIHI